MDDDPLTYIPPERLARLQRRYPIHWHEILDMLEADVIIIRGCAHPRFIVLACYPTWEPMLGLYDLAIPTETMKQGWRRRFRLVLPEDTRIEEMFPATRSQ